MNRKSTYHRAHRDKTRLFKQETERKVIAQKVKWNKHVTFVYLWLSVTSVVYHL